MVATRQRDATNVDQTCRRPGPPITGARTPAALALFLQRSAGNAAVARSVAPRLGILRNPHRRAPVLEPGTGYDGIHQNYGKVFDRALTTEQLAAAKDFRAWMEAGFTPQSGYAKGNWAREAGARVAQFAGTPQARASLYAEFQRQIVQATGGGGSSWKVSAERGADGSWIFRGNPALEAQRVFVVDPKGNCFSGLAKEGLPTSGPNKAVDYSKLRPVGVKAPPGGAVGGGGGAGGGGGGAAGGQPKVGTTSEPAGTGPKGEPAGSKSKPKATTSSGGGGTRVGGGAPEGKGPRMSFKGIGAFGLQMLALWWLGSRAEKAEAASLEKIMSAKISPKIDDAMKQKASDAEAMTTNAPWSKVYATITVDFDYTWTAMGIGGTPSREHVTDARFVSLTLGTLAKKSTSKITRDDKWVPLFSGDTDHDSTRRVSWTVEVDFGETEDQRRWRAHLKHAEEVVARGMSARAVAEASHFDDGGKRDTWDDTQRRKFGQKTSGQLREEADRELFVRAYIEYTAFHGPDHQYTAAIAYLGELEKRRAESEFKPMGRLGQELSERELKALEEFLTAGAR